MNKFYFTLVFSGFIGVSAIAQTGASLKFYKPSGEESRSTKSLFQSLIGEGIVLKNYSVTKTSSDEAFGFFDDNKASLGMKKGLIMTTGGISSISGNNTMPNMSNNTHAGNESRTYKGVDPNVCPELEKYLVNRQKTFDVCLLEMDIVPTADTLSFNYVFGSEEYDEFVGTEFNDIFAFLISGKDINGEKNLAVVPGTNTPVSVNTINNGKAGSMGRNTSNSTYYLSNMAGNIAIEYDGLTKLMQIRQPVTPYETYHIKLIIADVSDNSYDSGVLIEGQSFISYKKSYNLLYDKNSCEIESGYKKLLNDLAQQYKSKEGKIMLTGHTDAAGDEAKNNELSCCRAQAVADYLVSKGIDKTRIIMQCKGESMPVAPNNTEEGKELNRRVEIKLLGTEEEFEAKKQIEPKEEAAKLISNFPNPFTAFTTIEAYITDNTKNAHLLITDMNGVTVKSIYLLERGKTNVQFDGSYLASGIYNAVLYVDGKIGGTVKMVVTH